VAPCSYVVRSFALPHLLPFALLLLLALLVGAPLPVLADDSPVHPVEPVWAGPLRSTRDLAAMPPPPPSLVPGTRVAPLRTLVNLPDDPFLPQQWYFHNVGQVDEGGQQGTAGADIALFPALQVFVPRREVVLAIVDSGLDFEHEDVTRSVLWTNPGEVAGNAVDDDGNGYVDDMHGWNFVKNDDTIQERHYHGTHVNGLISAVVGNGVGITGGFPALRIMLVKIFDLGATATRDQIAEGIRYACAMGANVVSCSWGSATSSPAIREAIARCDEQGVLVVCAAGNSRKNLAVEPDYPCCYDLPNQVIVGATDNRDEPGLFANYGDIVDLSAPAKAIFSLMPKSKYRAFSGTSQACPQVAAAAALLMAHEPDLTHMQVKERLVATGDRLLPLKRFSSSAARLNVFNALTNTPGVPLPDEPQGGEWREVAYDLQSRHPYPYEADESYVVRVPGARALRIHFARFEFDTGDDYLDVRGADGRLVEKLNADLGSFWTEVVPGEQADLRLRSNKIVNCWGFHIDRVAWLAP